MKKIVILNCYSGYYYGGMEENLLPLKAIKWLVERTKSTDWFDTDFVDKNRDNPVLVECIETLGENGTYGNLVVDEYDDKDGLYTYEIRLDDRDREYAVAAPSKETVAKFVHAQDVDGLWTYLCSV